MSFHSTLERIQTMLANAANHPRHSKLAIDLIDLQELYEDWKRLDRIVRSYHEATKEAEVDPR